jgi:hypothetical protein
MRVEDLIEEVEPDVYDRVLLSILSAAAIIEFIYDIVYPANNLAAFKYYRLPFPISNKSVSST